MVTPDLYEILGVPRDASAAAIKAAFRRRAKTDHPDAGGDPEAFHLLKTAYDVLSDPEARRHYDETGETPDQREAGAAEEARFRTLVGDLLVAVIAQGGAPAFTDMLREIGDSVRNQIQAVDQQLVTLSHLAARLGEVLARLRGPESDDLLTALLKERFEEVEAKIRLTRALKTRLVRLQQKLGSYSYDVQIENIL